MRLWMLVPLLMLAATAARAADVCPTARNQQYAADPATRVAAVACNEHMLWYRPFIDRDGRIANTTVMESENHLLDDGASQAWRRVAGYWQESGLLRQMGGSAGAGECGYALGDRHPSPSCRAFVIDNAWSAAFISWVMRKARLPGFRASASHIDYVRDAYLRPETSAYQYLDPVRAKPAIGDLLCYVRGASNTLGYAGLLPLVNGGSGLAMHCDIVVAANPGNDSTAYLIGGNVQQAVTMRLLPLNRNGEFWSLPQLVDGGMPCSPDNVEACNFNRQDWAVLLKLKSPEVLAQLPAAAPFVPSSIMPSQPAPVCCVHCVVGSGVPRCPQPGTP
ncbi:MAG TPA: DUF2272 domain-containing protein [Pseudoxanthomonas sp.]